MNEWFMSEKFKDRWHKFFLLTDDIMMKLPMRGVKSDWEPPELPIALVGTIEGLIMLHKAFYHLLLKYAYSCAADDLLSASQEDRESGFWENERLYHFHDFFIRYRSFLDYAARFVAPIFSWEVVDQKMMQDNRIYFEDVCEKLRGLVELENFPNLEFVSRRQAIVFRDFLNSMDVRTSCNGKEREIIQTMIAGYRNQTTHQQLLPMDGTPWGFVKRIPPKPAKPGSDNKGKIERIIIGSDVLEFNALKSLALKTLEAIARSFDILDNLNFLKVKRE